MIDGKRQTGDGINVIACKNTETRALKTGGQATSAAKQINRYKLSHEQFMTVHCAFCKNILIELTVITTL